MTKEIAKELGKQAFKNNKPTAPIYCNEIMQIVYTNRDLGIKLMKSYIDGWHIENLSIATNILKQK